MLIFDAFLIWKKIAHSLRRTAVGKRELHRRNYSWAMEQIPKALPRIIWIYWDKPIEEAPPIVQAAVSSWTRHNPTWTIHLLTDQTVRSWVTLPEPQGPRKIQWKADLIRVSLLRDHGGVWVDATCFCRMPLDNWLPPLMQSGFFAFPDTYPGRMMQNWFLAAQPHNYLVTRWAEMLWRYYGKRGQLLHYFWVMHMFEYVVRADRAAAAIWNSTPRLSVKGPLLLKRIITQKDFAEPVPDGVDLRAIPVLKISSGTTTDDAEFVEALQQNRDIDLQKMISNILNR